jgi:hypothetical protein
VCACGGGGGGGGGGKNRNYAVDLKNAVTFLVA